MCVCEVAASILVVARLFPVSFSFLALLGFFHGWFSFLVSYSFPFSSALHMISKMDSVVADSTRVELTLMQAIGVQDGGSYQV